MDFVDVDEGVPQGNGLLDLWAAPGPLECALLGMIFPRGISHLLFHAHLAEWEREFALVSKGQDGMV